MDRVHDLEAVVFDVLGTLVDEPSGLRAAIRQAVPLPDAAVDDLLVSWQQYVEGAQQEIAQGRRGYVSTEVVDREAAQHVADLAGISDPAVLARLATAGQRLSPWGDSLSALERLATHLPVIGLSNAGRTALLRLNAYAGLRWHQALSAETVQAYKPAPEVYRLAVETAGCAPDRILMVAAHAWDLRGAQAVGMRTAYVERPVGDPPAITDTFDGYFATIDALVAELTG